MGAEKLKWKQNSSGNIQWTNGISVDREKVGTDVVSQRAHFCATFLHDQRICISLFFPLQMLIEQMCVSDIFCVYYDTHSLQRRKTSVTNKIQCSHVRGIEGEINLDL